MSILSLSTEESHSSHNPSEPQQLQSQSLDSTKSLIIGDHDNNNNIDEEPLSPPKEPMITDSQSAIDSQSNSDNQNNNDDNNNSNNNNSSSSEDNNNRSNSTPLRTSAPTTFFPFRLFSQLGSSVANLWGTSATTSNSITSAPPPNETTLPLDNNNEKTADQLPLPSPQVVCTLILH